MSKKSKYINFLTVTLIYLYFEVAFRLDMLDISSKMKDIIEVQTIEMVGRFLASFGFMVFLISNIEFSLKNKYITFISYCFIALLSFGLFYQAQTYVINNIGKNFNEKEKEKMLLLQMDKELIYFNKLNHKDFKFSNVNSSASKVLLAFYPFIRYNDDKHNNILSIGRELITTHSVNGKSSHNFNNFDIMVKKEAKFLNNLYISYYNTAVTPNDLRPFSRRSVIMTYRSLKNKFVYMYAPYRNPQNYKWKKEYIKRFDKLKKEHIVHSFIKNFTYHLNTTDDIEETINRVLYTNMFMHVLGGDLVYGLESHVNNFVYPMMGSLIKKDPKSSSYNYEFDYTKFLSQTKLSSPSLWQNCQGFLTKEDGFKIRMKSGSKYGDYAGKTQITSSVTKSQFLKFSEKLFGESKKYKVNLITCTLKKKDVEHVYNKAQKKILSSYLFSTNNKSMLDLTPSIINKSPKWRVLSFGALNALLRENGTDLYSLVGENYNDFKKFENNLDYSSETAFLNSVSVIQNSIYSDKFYTRAKDSGFNLDFLKGRNSRQYKHVEDFYEIPQIKKMLTKNAPFFINNKTGKVYKDLKITNVSDRKYLKNYAKYKSEQEIKMLTKVLKNTNMMKKGEKYEELGNDIAKSFVAIPFVLSISTIMIFLTLLNIIMKTISFYVEDKNKLNKIRIYSLLAFIILPAILPNEYFRNDNVIKFIETKTNKYIVFWFQNTQGILEMTHIRTYPTEMAYVGIKMLSYELFTVNIEDKKKYSGVKDKILQDFKK